MLSDSTILNLLDKCCWNFSLAFFWCNGVEDIFTVYCPWGFLWWGELLFKTFSIVVFVLQHWGPSPGLTWARQVLSLSVTTITKHTQTHSIFNWVFYVLIYDDICILLIWLFVVICFTNILSFVAVFLFSL